MNLATIEPSTIKQGSLTRRVLAVVSAVGMAAVALLQAMPASATEADGDPRMKCVQQDPYYFHGVSGLQGGFSTDAPTNPAPAVQLAPAPASWADSFQGDLCGQATVTFYVTRVEMGTSHVAVLADDSVIARMYGVGGTTPPQEVTLTFQSGATVVEKLEFRYFKGSAGFTAFFYDSPDYAAGFTVSTLQPCEEIDPHPDCVEAGFADLAGDVRAFASTGEVTADGETQLLAALEDAETAYDGGGGDNARAVARLEDFQQLVGDPALVPGEPARDALTAAASDLIAALGGSGSA